MKTRSNLIGCLCIGLLFGLSVSAQKTPIAKSSLPANAQTFLKTHFTGQEPNYIIEDKETFTKDYKVQFANNIEVEFDSKGNWEEVDGNHAEIPTTMIPKSILSYVKANFANTAITKIDKGSWGYEVDLNNGIELEFNSKGNFIRIDN
ncbi:PepSY-like domain-containing protein [Flavobacterium branchiicola]|uniref:PepSY-like domain-containing protein n=1 Tax=Flavobacterium branchiicola TaxID=1114875 RepID=A0ABV9PHU3_9FLAO|nr:PepSY-like domain-containing protein [Flavobacterium branchiicola]MBS7255658.1 PepSY-like domain-containing protein [Flavobacterium branchiicola]